MARLSYSRRAIEDLDRIAQYIGAESGSARIARTFVSRLRQRCLRLASLGGELGTLRPEVAPGLRSTPFGNYLILFRYEDRSLRVLAIIEGHRNLHDPHVIDPRRSH